MYLCSLISLYPIFKIYSLYFNRLPVKKSVWLFLTIFEFNTDISTCIFQGENCWFEILKGGILWCSYTRPAKTKIHNGTRLISECGGKNFHFVHKSADVKSVAVGTVRSAFEYGGQKCSACSRMYIPQSMWPEVKQKMLDILKEIQLGSPLDNKIFLSAVIDDKVWTTSSLDFLFYYCRSTYLLLVKILLFFFKPNKISFYFFIS